MRIIIYGPQGSGKTTQVKLLAKKLGLLVISAGEISREIASEGTKEGKHVKQLLDQGNPTPWRIFNPRLKKIFNCPKARKGYVLDGFPRFSYQMSFLNSFLKQTNTEIDKVVLINLSQRETVSRMLSRAKKENRGDDTPEAIARRLQLYRDKTKPIIDCFLSQGKVVEVDGRGTVEDVHKLILQALNL